MSDQPNNEAAANENPAGESAEAPKKNKKINKMTLQEVEKTIENAKKTQGGVNSRYSKELLARKELLTEAKK